MANKVKPTAFKLRGFEATIRHLVREVQEIYRADAIPWVVGYSGGKDSTATLQIVWPEPSLHQQQDILHRQDVLNNYWSLSH